MARYEPNNSSILDNLAAFEANGVAHGFNVDATRLTETAQCWSGECTSIIWTYPFPESNASDVQIKSSLIGQFFDSVLQWPSFARNGVVVLGLKSCSATKRHATTDEDYQYRQWNVESIARDHGFGVVSTFGPVRPFWHATHVTGRPLFKRKERRCAQVFVKFYAFQQHGESHPVDAPVQTNKIQ